MDKLHSRNNRIVTKLVLLTICIIVGVAMMPSTAFALEENIADTEASMSQDVITEETTQEESIQSDEINTEDLTEEVTESPTETIDETQIQDAIDVEGEVVVKAEGEDNGKEDVSAGVNTGTILQNTSKYSKRMRIYGIYMHRANGTRVDSDRYGDAVLIESNGRFLLMDTGAIYPIKDNDSACIHSSLVSTLKRIGVKELDVYISHLHGDHTGGLEDICNNFKVRRLYLPDLKLCENYHTPSGLSIESRYAKNIDIAKDGGVKEIVFLKPSFREHKNITYEGVNYASNARVASKFSVGAATFSVIGPVGTYNVNQFKRQDGECGTKEGHCLNNCSLVTVVQCGKFRFLTAGDIETQEEAALVREYGYDLNCNMLKASHHSLRTSSSQSFLNKVTPMWSFEQDHGFRTGTAAQIRRMKNKGYNFSILGRKCNFIADISNSKARIFIDANNNGRIDERPLTGCVSVAGDKVRYQYYNSRGFILTEWKWMYNALYYLDDNSGFRHTGKSVIRGVNVEFNEYGRLISHKPPKQAKIKSIKALKKKRIKITWKKTKRASAYKVLRKTGKNGTYRVIGTYGNKKRTLTDKRGIKRGKTYYYKVVAIRYVAGGTMYGVSSKVKKVKAR